MGRSVVPAAAGGMHGFPAAVARFIGRAGPVREVAGLGKRRLVTATGPGKTRRLGEAGQPVAGRLADTAWLAAAQDRVRVACGGCRAGGLGLGVRQVVRLDRGGVFR